MVPLDERETIPAYRLRVDRAAILRWFLPTSPQVGLPGQSNSAEIAGRVRNSTAAGRLGDREPPVSPPPAPEPFRSNRRDLEVLGTAFEGSGRSKPQVLSGEHHSGTPRIARGHSCTPRRIPARELEPTDQVTHRAARRTCLGGRVERREVKSPRAFSPAVRLGLHLD
jgi:hypothetical protein